jgi:hypothetical protein
VFQVGKDEELLNYKELSEKLKMNITVLRQYKAKGMPFVLAGKTPRFYLSEVMEYFNKNTNVEGE